MTKLTKEICDWLNFNNLLLFKEQENKTNFFQRYEFVRTETLVSENIKSVVDNKRIVDVFVSSDHDWINDEIDIIRNCCCIPYKTWNQNQNSEFRIQKLNILNFTGKQWRKLFFSRSCLESLTLTFSQSLNVM